MQRCAERQERVRQTDMKKGRRRTDRDLKYIKPRQGDRETIQIPAVTQTDRGKERHKTRETGQSDTSEERCVDMPR